MHKAIGDAARIARRGAIEARAVAEMFRAGMFAGGSPRTTLTVLAALRELGQLGAAAPAAATRHPERTGLLDDLGSLSFGQIDGRSSALAYALRGRGIGPEDCIAILCRNHRGFLDASFAAAKLGARVLYLNTDFAAPQLADVCARERVTLLVHDSEFRPLVDPIHPRHGKLLAWTDAGKDSGEPGAGHGETLEHLIVAYAGRRAPAPSRHARVVLLTSGTTGRPKGAPRSSTMSVAPIGALLSKVPYRAGEATYIAPPMFHGLAYTQMLLALSLGSTIITARQFVPESVLEAIQRARPTGLVLVPVMLRRMLTLLEEQPGRWDTSSLRVVFMGGAQLEAELVRRAQRTLGDKLYNFYGTTEVAFATFATPDDLRVAPGCVGRAPFGATLRLYDAHGARITSPDRVGRIFVGNGFQFEGYSGGGGKELIDGLMSTGDVGHFDAAGRLYIDGRDDEMIVSGGENVFPAEVEELLITHPGVEEAAVIGVRDDDFGQRLAAFVVRRPGAEPAADELKEFVRQRLARFKVPREVLFIDTLPRNPSGKVLKRTLRELDPGGRTG